MSGKGGSFERKVCKDLSKWIQGTDKPYIFWRGRGSGGTFTTNNLVGEDFAGDVYAVRDEGRFFTNKCSIELKTGYKEASLDKTLKYNTSDPLLAHWIQCSNDARKVDKYPLLVFQKKGVTPIWVGIAKEMEKSLRKQLVGCRYVHICWAEPTEDVWLFSYIDFFSVITPQVFKDFVI